MVPPRSCTRGGCLLSVSKRIPGDHRGSLFGISTHTHTHTRAHTHRVVQEKAVQRNFSLWLVLLLSVNRPFFFTFGPRPLRIQKTFTRRIKKFPRCTRFRKSKDALWIEILERFPYRQFVLYYITLHTEKIYLIWLHNVDVILPAGKMLSFMVKYLPDLAISRKGL